MRTSNRINKIMVMIMALCLIVSYLPLSVYAAADDRTDISGEQEVTESDDPDRDEDVLVVDADGTDSEEHLETETADAEDKGDASGTDAAGRIDNGEDAAIDQMENLDDSYNGSEVDRNIEAGDSAQAPAGQGSSDNSDDKDPGEDQDLTTTDDEAFDPGRADYLSYDPLYVARYIDTALVNADDVDLARYYSIVTAAKGVATYNVRKQKEFDITETNFIAGMSYELPIYNIDDDSDYYVAIPNVNKFNDNFTAYDLMLTYNNDYGEVIDGWKYKKGILYIPKCAVDEPANEYPVPENALLAVQLNYAIGGDMDFSKSIPVQVLTDEEPVDKTTHVPNIFDLSTLVVETGEKHRKADDISVFLNGNMIPANSEAWSYDSNTGEIQILECPGVISNINVVFEPRNAMDKTRDILTGAIDAITPDAYAVSMSDMYFFKDSKGHPITLDVASDSMFAGWRGSYGGVTRHGYNNVKDLTGWKNSIQYMYGGYDNTDYVAETSSNAYKNQHLASVWAISSYAFAVDLSAGGSGKSLKKDTKLTHWNNSSGVKANQTKTIYEWLLVYRNKLERTKQNYGRVNGVQVNNGIGGVNNHAFTFPKKITGAPTSLVSDKSSDNYKRKNKNITFRSEEIEKAQGNNEKNTYYDYWIAAGCNHLNTSVEAEEDDKKTNHRIYVTCLGVGSDWCVLAFCRVGYGSQNACGIYKFKTPKPAKAKIKKVFSQDASKYPEGATVKGAVYWMYKDSSLKTRAVDVKGNKVVFTTGSDGNSNKVTVDPGTYWIKEKKASPGCKLNTTRIKAVLDEGDDKVFTSKEAPKEKKEGAVSVRKRPSVTTTDYLKDLPDNYGLEGAVYHLYTDKDRKNRAKDIDGNEIELETDENGETDDVSVAPGTYYVKEVTASQGFLLDEAMNKDNKPVVVPETAAGKKTPSVVIESTEVPAFSTLEISLEKTTEGSKGYSDLLGAVYRLSYYDIDPDSDPDEAQNQEPLRSWLGRVAEKTDQDGRKYAGFEFMTDPYEEGSDEAFYEDNRRVLPCGIVTIQEEYAPKGMEKDDTIYYGRVYQPKNGSGAITSFEGKDHLKVSNHDKELRLLHTEDVQHIILGIRKKDAITGLSEAQGRDRSYSRGSLANAVFDVFWFDPDIQKDVLVGNICTDENGAGELREDLLYTTSEDKRLKVGRYTIAESQASPGYVKSPPQVIEIRGTDDGENRLVYSVNDVLEQPHRTVFHKKDGSTEGTELKDARLQIIDAKGHVVDEWVTDGKTSHEIMCLNDGEYILREISAPYGYDAADDLHFKVTADSKDSEITMLNTPVTIGTRAQDTFTGSQNGIISDQEVVTDEVTYSGLHKGRTYMIRGTLIDKSTGNPLLDKNGNDITSELEFTPESGSGTQSVKFELDSGGFVPGTAVVAFEKIYRISPREGITQEVLPVELQKHEDPEDKKQAIYYGGIIGTTALDKQSGSHNALSGPDTVIEDNISYRGLIPGETYTIHGSLADKESGKEIGVFAEETFTPDSADGTLQVEFEKFDASGMQGRALVAFEKILVNDVLLSEHADLSDTDQTVYFPEVLTRASLTSERVTDEISYSNLLGGAEYVVRGYLVDRKTGRKLKRSEGETAITTSEEHTDGTAYVELPISDISRLAGYQLTAFEELWLKGDNGEEFLVADHKDIDNTDQTVEIPSEDEPDKSEPGIDKPSEPDVPSDTGNHVPGSAPKTGESRATMYIAAAILLLSAAYIVRRKRSGSR